MAKPPASKKSRPAAKPPAPPRAKPNGNGKPANGNGKGAKSAAKKAVVTKPTTPAKAPAASKAAKPKAAAAVPAAATPVADKKTRQQTELEGKLLHLISEEMAIEEAELTPNALLKEDLNLDPIDVAELLMQAEVNFNVHPFTEADWDTCATVGDYLALVGKRVEAKRSRKRV